MSKWIDADALIAELQKDEERFDKEAEDCRKNSRNYTDCYMQAMSSRADGIRDAIVEVDDAPSIDIVRCKECRKSHIDGKTTHYLWCTEWGRSTDTFGYCERGEREGE